jgi:hypothetical protein
MLFLIKTLKSFLKIFNSLAAPWQVFLGTLLGALLGFLPFAPSDYDPSPLALCLLFLAIVINCHLGSCILFFGLSWLLAKALTVPAVIIGNSLDGLARASADISFLHMSLWSHTGYLGLTVLGIVIAPIFAFGMWRFTIYFRTKLRDRLLANRKLVTAGKVGGNTTLLKIVCWFFDL